MLTSFAILAFLTFAAFGMQRTTLLLSREANTSSRYTAMLLPAWFPAVWLLVIAKWVLLLNIAVSWSWLMATGFLIGEFSLSAVLPIPYQIYMPTFRRRIVQLRSKNPELADTLDALLKASKINAS